MYDLKQDDVSVAPDHYIGVAIGMEVWRQHRIEFMPRSVEGGTSVLIKSLLLKTGKELADLREKVHKLEGEIRAYDSMTQKIYDPEFLKIALPKIIPEELETHWRRAHPHEDMETASTVREVLMTECACYGKMRSQKGANMPMNGQEPFENQELVAEFSEAQWLADADGNDVCIDPGTLNALIKGKGRGRKGKGGENKVGGKRKGGKGGKGGKCIQCLWCDAMGKYKKIDLKRLLGNLRRARPAHWQTQHIQKAHRQPRSG